MGNQHQKRAETEHARKRHPQAVDHSEPETLNQTHVIPLSPASIMKLQRTIGNQAVQRLLVQRSPLRSGAEKTTPIRHWDGAQIQRAPQSKEATAKEEDPYEKWKVRKQTRYGEYVLWSSDAPGVLPKLESALSANENVRSMHQNLQENLRNLGVVEARIHGVAAPPRDLDKEIAKNANKTTIHMAETAENAKNSVEIVRVTLEDFKGRLSMAHSAMKLSNRSLESAEKKVKARELREKGEKQEQLIQTALTIVGAAIEVTVAVITKQPSGVIKPAWDAITALYQLFDENNLVAQAESLEKEAQAIDMEVAAGQYRLAAENLKHVSGRLNDALAKAKDVEKDYLRQRGRVESEYDKTTRGKFRFGELARGIELAERTYEQAHQTMLGAYDAENAVHALTRVYRELVNEWHGEMPASRAVSSAMLKDAIKWREEALQARKLAESNRTTFQALRIGAHEALVNANSE